MKDLGINKICSTEIWIKKKNIFTTSNFHILDVDIIDCCFPSLGSSAITCQEDRTNGSDQGPWRPCQFQKLNLLTKVSKVKTGRKLVSISTPGCLVHLYARVFGKIREKPHQKSHRNCWSQRFRHSEEKKRTTVYMRDSKVQSR